MSIVAAPAPGAASASPPAASAAARQQPPHATTSMFPIIAWSPCSELWQWNT